MTNASRAMPLRTKPTAKVYLLLPALFALSSASCADLMVPEGAAGGAADEVAVSRQDLGSWSQRYKSQWGYTTVTSLTSQYTMFAGSDPQCTIAGRRVEVFLTEAGLALAAPPIPDAAACEKVSALWGGNNQVFVGDSGNKRIYRLMYDASWNPYWLQVVTTPGGGISRIRSSSTQVFWSDSLGMHRAPIGGGAITDMAGPSSQMLEIDGNYLYAQRYNSADSTYTLQRFSTAGGVPTSLRTRATAFGPITFNASHFFFMNGDIDAQHWRIYKLTKSGSTLTTFADVPWNDFPRGLQANATHLY